ncbi:response regulator transcription factor [Ottowia testudinis]|uniref:Response regulator transcription factor n=1 Tax=Ottowia testudinis TaxID=2816950 RepID=A0A975CHE9_9BURK|nr:response regulator transcription factor [Ottowia testudinis]QTD45639.1 response regulator transcription factor [Ottowia testudinis]
MTSASTPNALILVAEDDRDISQILTGYLEQAGFRTVTAFDGETALSHVAMLKPDLMLLDLKLPLRDGFGVLSALRVDNRLPVIVISALADDLDKLSALRIGADDYVTKPFNPKEVVARVEAVLRRSQPAPATDVLRLGEVALDAAAHQVTVRGEPLDLTLSEFRLLSHLLRRPGQAHTRAALLDACLEESEALERTVDSHISHLRRKLQQAGAGVQLATVRSVGYRLELG